MTYSQPFQRKFCYRENGDTLVNTTDPLHCWLSPPKGAKRRQSCKHSCGTSRLSIRVKEQGFFCVGAIVPKHREVPELGIIFVISQTTQLHQHNCVVSTKSASAHGALRITDQHGASRDGQQHNPGRPRNGGGGGAMAPPPAPFRDGDPTALLHSPLRSGGRAAGGRGGSAHTGSTEAVEEPTAAVDTTGGHFLSPGTAQQGASSLAVSRHVTGGRRAGAGGKPRSLRPRGQLRAETSSGEHDGVKAAN